MTKKKLSLLLCLLLALCLLGSCAYLPFEGLSDMNAAADDGDLQALDGDTVILSREDYERYKQFDTLLELMDLVEYGYFEEYDVQDMLDGMGVPSAVIITAFPVISCQVLELLCL